MYKLYLYDYNIYMIWTNFMGKDARVRALLDFLQKQRVVTLDQLVDEIECNDWTIRRYLKQLSAITSYTHSGRYITLSSIPEFDSNGIWFYRKIGFTKFSSSLDLIVQVINSSKTGLTREDIQKIVRIQIFQQIRVLLERNQIHRVKVGNKYLYIPEKAASDKKARLQIVGSLQVEERYDREIKIVDLISVIKIVLQEGKIDLKLLKGWMKKYALAIPLAKLENVIQKHKLEEKKTP